MMLLRGFGSKNEEKIATDIIATIDQGEKWIFQDAEGSSDFGGFIDKLSYCDGNAHVRTSTIAEKPINTSKKTKADTRNLGICFLCA